jgi:predicted enzyme related to lactoylglutathione lyase
LKIGEHSSISPIFFIAVFHTISINILHLIGYKRYNLAYKFTIQLIADRKDMLGMLNLNSIMIGTTQPKVLAAFYEKVLGKPAQMVDDAYGFYGWQAGTAYLSVLNHSEMVGHTKDPGRMMFNFETTQVKEEFERLKALGATVIKEPYDMEGGWIATLADPDGNYFQLVTPMPMGQ